MVEIQLSSKTEKKESTKLVEVCWTCPISVGARLKMYLPGTRSLFELPAPSQSPPAHELPYRSLVTSSYNHRASRSGHPPGSVAWTARIPLRATQVGSKCANTEKEAAAFILLSFDQTPKSQPSIILTCSMSL